MAKSKKFPRTLYKKDGEGKLSFTTNRNKSKVTVKYNSVIVKNEEELETAVQELGYVDSFASILEREVEEAPEEANDEEF